MQTRSRSSHDVTQTIARDARDGDADTNNNSKVKMQDGDFLLRTSNITDKDYEQDEEFQDIFHYVTTGGLTEDDRKDKVTLLMADQYFVEDGGLYRLSIPRNKRVKNETTRRTFMYPKKILF